MGLDSDRLLRTFIDLVKIESPSFKEREVADYLVGEIDSLGWEAEADGNVVLRLPGVAPAPPLLFCAHMDTVEPLGGVDPVVRSTRRGGPATQFITNRNDTILGADDKAGVAALLEMLRVIAAGKVSHGSLEIVFTFGEEKGLLGIKALDFSKVKARYGFAVDGDGPVGTIIVKAPHYNRLKATFAGKAAHAGVDPEDGVNAVRAASLAVAGAKLGRIDDETTANIGIINGGRAANIVPEAAYVEGETRSHDAAKLETQTEQMVSAFRRGAKEAGATVEVQIEREFSGFGLNKGDAVVALTLEAIKELELRPRLAASGGGSDTNVLNEKGIPSVNLATGAEKVHSADESISVQELERLSALLLAVVAVAVRRGSAG